MVYSVAFSEESGKVFIADAFMKDSREGSEMRKADRTRIDGRLKKHRMSRREIRRKLLH